MYSLSFHSFRSIRNILDHFQLISNIRTDYSDYLRNLLVTKLHMTDNRPREQPRTKGGQTGYNEETIEIIYTRLHDYLHFSILRYG